jgi:hypothetical protein
MHKSYTVTAGPDKCIAESGEKARCNSIAQESGEKTLGDFIARRIILPEKIRSGADDQ